jgi:hypothetical protein
VWLTSPIAGKVSAKTGSWQARWDQAVFRGQQMNWLFRAIAPKKGILNVHLQYLAMYLDAL